MQGKIELYVKNLNGTLPHFPPLDYILVIFVIMTPTHKFLLGCVKYIRQKAVGNPWDLNFQLHNL